MAQTEEFSNGKKVQEMTSLIQKPFKISRCGYHAKRAGEKASALNCGNYVKPSPKAASQIGKSIKFLDRHMPIILMEVV